MEGTTVGLALTLVPSLYGGSQTLEQTVFIVRSTKLPHRC